MNDRLFPHWRLWPALLGLIVFPVSRGFSAPVWWAAVALAVAVAWCGRRRPWLETVLAPLGLALLVPLLRLTQWDAADFRARADLLLGAALLWALWRLGCSLDAWARLTALFARQSRRRRLVFIFLCAEIFFILAAVGLTRGGVQWVGDEPHYLAVAQSMAQDGDLNLWNQYFRGKFREFMDVAALPPHANFGLGYKRLYSYHLPGVAVTVAPFMALHLPPPLLFLLVRAFLGLFGALLAVLIYLFAQRLQLGEGLALLVTALFCLSAPVFFFSVHVFPEVQAMLLVLAALYLLLFPGKHPHRSTLLGGLLLGLTIFWGVKYALFIYLYAAGFSVLFLRRRQWRRLVCLLAPLAALQAVFFAGLYLAYGTIAPSAVYYGIPNPQTQKQFYDTVFRTITLNMRLETLLDYFIDQRDGLFPYNPFYLFALPGLILALRRFRLYAVHLLLAVPPLVFVLNHAFSTIRAGHCPQGRYLTPVVWVLLLFAVIFRKESENAFFRRLWYALPLYSFCTAAWQVLHPLTLYQATTHDVLHRPGLLFQQWSNLYWDWSALLPSFAKMDNSRHWPNYVWAVGLILFTAAALVRLRRAPGRVSAAVVFLAVLAAAVALPRPGLYNPVTVEAAGVVPHVVYQENVFPQRRSAPEEVRWERGDERTRLVIETRRPVARFRLEWAGAAARRLTVENFDRPLLAEREVAGTGGLELADVRFRRRGPRFLYSFSLRLDTPAGRPRPQVKLYPLER